MIRVSVLIILLVLPRPVQASGAIHCGFAQRLCECSALFAVLETSDDDAELEAKLRSKSQELRELVYRRHGRSGGDRMVDSQIKALQDSSDDLKDGILLAQMLSRCSGYISGADFRPRVLVTP